MAAFTSFLAAGALALGAAQYKQSKDAAADTRRQVRRQETKAKEASLLKGPKQQNTRIKVGSDDRGDYSKGEVSSKGTGKRKANTGAGKSLVFGSLGKSRSASYIGGL